MIPRPLIPPPDGGAINTDATLPAAVYAACARRTLPASDDFDFGVRELRAGIRWMGKHRYTIAWVVWILGFFGIEGMALRQPEDNENPRTLSRHTWVWFDITEKGTAWRAKRVALLAFLGWLVVHFMTGGWM